MLNVINCILAYNLQNVHVHCWSDDQIVYIIFIYILYILYVQWHCISDKLWIFPGWSLYCVKHYLIKYNLAILFFQSFIAVEITILVFFNQAVYIRVFRDHSDAWLVSQPSCQNSSVNPLGDYPNSMSMTFHYRWFSFINNRYKYIAVYN